MDWQWVATGALSLLCTVLGWLLAFVVGVRRIGHEPAAGTEDATDVPARQRTSTGA